MMNLRSSISIDIEDEERLEHYNTKKALPSIERQKRFGAEYMLSGNALSEKDLNVLNKYADITQSTSSLGKSHSRKLLKPITSPLGAKANLAIAEDMSHFKQLQLHASNDYVSGYFHLN